MATTTLLGIALFIYTDDLTDAALQTISLFSLIFSIGAIHKLITFIKQGKKHGIDTIKMVCTSNCTIIGLLTTVFYIFYFSNHLPNTLVISVSLLFWLQCFYKDIEKTVSEYTIRQWEDEADEQTAAKLLALFEKEELTASIPKTAKRISNNKKAL